MSQFFKIDEKLNKYLQSNGYNDVSLYVFSDLSIDLKYGKTHYIFVDNLLLVLNEKHEIIFKINHNDIDNIKIEYLLNYGKIYIAKKNTYTLIGYFSKNYSNYFETFKKNLVSLLNFQPILKEQSNNYNYCPKCKRLLNKQGFCPSCYSKTNTLLRLFSYIKKYKLTIFVLVFLLLLTSCIGIFSPIYTNQIFYNEFLANNGHFFNHILLFAAFFLLLKVISALINIVYGRIFAKTSAKICYDLKSDVFSAMQKLSLKFFLDKDSGSLMNRVVFDVNMIFYFIIDDIPKIFTSLMEIIGISIYLICLNYKLTFLIFIPLPIVAILFIYFMPLFKRKYQQNIVSNNELTSIVSDTLEGFRVVKVFSNNLKESKRFSKISFKNKKSFISNGQLKAFIYPLIQLLAAFSMIVIWGIGGYYVINDINMDYGIFATFVAAVEILFVPLEAIGNIIFTNLAMVITSSRRIFEIIDSDEKVKVKDNVIELNHINGDVEFKHVSFSYEPTKLVLDDISFKINANSSLGIVGTTGQGKTTIVNLLSRLYEINEGQILIDNIDIKDISLASLRKQISLISQDTYLFKGSILDNIRYARPQATLNEVIEASKKANAHEFILSLKEGYDTIIGEGNVLLSAGQRQRISIARAILLDSKIIIFDEATSAMDTITEKAIQDSIKNISNGKTIIMIAHRLSTINDVDKIIVLENHKIIEQGTHQELLLNNKVFAKLYRIQADALDYIKIGGKH